ncbi:DUF732 domain-containing protein [[Mycobacterium] nativiensis]|uniref:DUF732 domain-containing protein n=1 Tax=[Mycobacterium] nativiensis TaxID=2855503 RepID=A0ABU5XTJ0_9MYCO|nr:DUF732 domain-containing protein [Mycolicibacter sp. MYC340]MEB3031248.1 DUF732 domain-containing protein [Mycolicibacter sp. MYC340]
MVRQLVVPAALAVALVCAGPAPADPDPADNDAAFIASLRQSGIRFADEVQAIAAAHSVCGLIDNGESGLQVVKELNSDNSGLTMDGAARFAAIAANSYCPDQLKGAK